MELDDSSGAGSCRCVARGRVRVCNARCHPTCALTDAFARLRTSALTLLTDHPTLQAIGPAARQGSHGSRPAAAAGNVALTIDKLSVFKPRSRSPAVNGPKSVVIAGAEAEVAAVLGELGAERPEG